jgi:hypothetical protein
MSNQYRLNQNEVKLIQFIRSLDEKKLASITKHLALQSINDIRTKIDTTVDILDIDLMDESTCLRLSQILRNIIKEK